jgi:DNA-binding response OmpR family regulator
MRRIFLTCFLHIVLILFSNLRVLVVDIMILIVDDKKENLLSLQSLLSLHSFPVDTATNGEEALKKVLKNSYALIILDVQMPGMDGFEVAETISGYSKAQDVPIIFLSAVNTDKKFITKGYSSGAIDYITKPIDPDILLLKVNTLYRLYEQKRQLNEVQASLRSEIEFRKQAQLETNEKALELKFILESIPQIAFTTRADGTIEYTNSRWLNYARSENEFPKTHPEDGDIAGEIIKMVESKLPLEMEVRVKARGQDNYRYHLLRVLPVKENSQIIKWVGTFTDIEEQKQASKKKDEFISVASHELKTPLTSIQGYVQLLERSVTADDSSRAYISRALTQIKKLDTLIADLLDISKIESGKLKLNMHEFNFGNMLEETLQMIRQTYPEHQVTFAGNVHVMVKGDETRLEQVIVNFISNAIKYSPDSRQVKVTAEIVSGNKLMVKVRDFGIGISLADQTYIFDKFYRSETSSARFQGLGIGLYICADILQRHQCEFGVDSEPGKGSTFYFAIPYLKQLELT